MSVPCVLCKDDVKFAVIAPGGFAILAAVQAAAAALRQDMMITAGTDGQHSGPADPHFTGNAYDIRCNNLDAATTVKLIDFLNATLGPQFFVLHELPGATAATTGEHIHIQVAHGVTYP